MSTSVTKPIDPSAKSGDPTILAQCAPGVTRLIENSIFSSGQKQQLKEQLAEAITVRREHEWLKRTPGVSFNPLPARVIEILIRECHCTDYGMLEAALLLSTVAEDTLTISNAPCADAYTAYALDTLRHLHYDVVSKEVSTEILTKLSLEQQPIAQMTRLPRLHVLYDAAFRRVSKRFQDENEI